MDKLQRIYLDHNATTPLHPAALEAMLPFLREHHGNASSIHAEGREARAAVDDARDAFAQMLGSKPHELIFTGGGTESNNLGVLGLALAKASSLSSSAQPRVAVSAVEHHAVLHAAEVLQKRHGFALDLLPVDSNGVASPHRAEEVIRPETVLISVMSANNETGVKQPVTDWAAFCSHRGILLHCDAVQSFGKETVRVKDWPVDALSIAGHKFYGPKGVGLLFVKSGVPLSATQAGGAQENQRRPGTENVAAIVGMATAAKLALEVLKGEQERQRQLVKHLWDRMQARIQGIQRNGMGADTLCNTLNVSFERVHGEELLMACDLAGLSLSSGSACMVGSVQASHVLLAMGVTDDMARATLRFSMGKNNTLEEMEWTVERVARIVERLRNPS